MPKGRPRKVVEDPAVIEKQKDSKLLDINALDQIIMSKQGEVAILDERRSALDLQLHAIEQDIERKQKDFERDMLIRKQENDDTMMRRKDQLELAQRETELIMQSLATREASIQIKEEEMARFDEERRRFQDKALYIEQTEMAINDRMVEADGLKREYEAMLDSLAKLQGEAEQLMADAQKIQESNRVRATLLDEREKVVVTKEATLLEAKLALRHKTAKNGSLA